jgi:hypothetical protein
VAAYEELRLRLLGGSTRGSHFGLVVILQEGIAAWIARGSAAAAALKPAAEPNPRSAAPNLPNDVHAGVVRVLAGMALSIRREVIL